MNGHSRHPHKIDNWSWFYDDKAGIIICREILDKNGNYIHTEQFKIRWPSLIAAVKRHIQELKK